MYIVALLCPPLAIFLCGRPFLALFSVILLIGYFPAALVALLVVSNKYAQKRHLEQIAAIGEQTKTVTKAMKAASAASIKASAQRPSPVPTQAVAAAPKAAAAPAPAVASLPRAPLMVRIKDGVAAIGPAFAATKEAAIQAYQDLPEWAQPITWGLAAGTPVSMAFVLFMVMKK